MESDETGSANQLQRPGGILRGSSPPKKLHFIAFHKVRVRHKQKWPIINCCFFLGRPTVQYKVAKMAKNVIKLDRFADQIQSYEQNLKAGR